MLVYAEASHEAGSSLLTQDQLVNMYQPALRAKETLPVATFAGFYDAGTPRRAKEQWEDTEWELGRDAQQSASHTSPCRHS